MLGIDYASIDEDKPPDFAAASDYGVRFVVVRAAYTYGGAAKVDPTAARDRAAIKAAGLQFGAYLILGWNVDPEQQVATFVQAYGDPDPGDLPPSLDIEFPGHGISDTGLKPADALAKIETALSAMQATYPTVMLYTSGRVWTEDLHDIASDACGQCPGWIKVAYPYRRDQPPHLEAIPSTIPLPVPLRAAGSPGAFIEQFQGDALKVPGFTSTVDLNVFRSYIARTADARTPWIAARLAALSHPCDATDATSVANAIRAFQTERSLDADGVVGARTFAALCAKPAS